MIEIVITMRSGEQFCHFILHSLNGYSTASSLGELTVDDIDGLEDFAKYVPKTITDYCTAKKIPYDSALCEYFLGFQMNSETFRLFNGHKLLLRRIPSLVNETLGRGISFLVFDGIQDGTIQTSIGDLFAPQGLCLKSV